jgi:sugar lactone lactonase YvrE
MSLFPPNKSTILAGRLGRHSARHREDRRRSRGRLRFGWVVGVVAVVAVVLTAGASAVTGSNTITTVAGIGEPGFSGDGGPATSARIWVPSGLAFDPQGNMYIADPGDPNPNDRIRKVTPGGTITTFAGGGSIPGPGIGDGGPATLAELNVPEAVAVDGVGNVYIADRNNWRIRKVNAAGTITTFAGGGNPIPPDVGDDGPATSARLQNPDGVAVDGQGNVYIADRDQMRVRKVNAAGIITTIAGDGTQGEGGDGGPATSAQLRFPHGLAVDGQGNLYIADYQNQRVRKVNAAGIITTVAGTGYFGICSPNLVCGDGGPATSATLQSPTGVALDAQGSLYIVMASRVRKVDAAGIITTITSAYDPGPYPGDGLPAIVAKTFGPYAVTVDGQGSLYIAESYGSRVRKVDAGSQSSVTIDFAALAAKTYGDPDFTVSATASSGLPVSFAASGNCTVSGATVHITGAGSCTITASQPGDVNNPPAPNESRTFAIGKASQTITFATLANKTYGNPDFAVSASASSGLAVFFAASGNCTVSGSTVHTTSPGSCTITASQLGNANYNPAAAVSQTFSIASRLLPPTRCTVPNVVGKRLGAAKLAIRRRHCRTGQVGYAYARKRKKGIVVSQSRRPGRVLPANSKINLVVSRGRRR